MAVIPSADLLILRLTTVHENSDAAMERGHPARAAVRGGTPATAGRMPALHFQSSEESRFALSRIELKADKPR
jgi:hypothetical protein